MRTFATGRYGDKVVCARSCVDPKVRGLPSVQFLGGRLYEWSVPQNSNRVLFSHLTSLSDPHHAQRTSANGSHEASRGEGPGSSDGVGGESSCRVSETNNEDDVDLVYWASRLAEQGARMGPWGRGPDLPQLAADIQPL